MSAGPQAPPGLRNGFRSRRMQTAEGELSVEIPQVREAAEPFVSKLFPRGTKLLRTEPLKAMVIGAFVRGLSMRESHEDWQALGRDLISRGLGAPMLIVADGAPGLIKAVEQCWPSSDRQHCAVHRVRNLLAKLPERERERVRQQYWQALNEATNERDGHQRLQGLADQLDTAGYTAAAKCLADDLPALVVHLRYPTRHRRRWRSTNLLERSLGEVKRGTKVIGRFPGRTSCLTLVWAVLDLYITHATNVSGSPSSNANAYAA